MQCLKYICTLFLIVGLSTPSVAQLVCVLGDYTATLPMSDSVMVTAYNTTFPALPSGSNIRWDLSSILDSNVVFDRYSVPNDTFRYADSSRVQPFGALSFPLKYNISAIRSGFYECGFDNNRVAYSLASRTGSTTDSIIIDSGRTYYSAPNKKIPLPLSYTTGWKSGYSSDQKFHITIPSLSITNAPGAIRSIYAISDTVSGWGMIRIPKADGGASEWWDVLQVRHKTIKTDSFYLNGSPMPGSLLTLLGLRQGITDTSYSQMYYRWGEWNPLVSIKFADSAYRQPVQCSTVVSRLMFAAIDEVRKPVFYTQIYPNPIVENQITILTNAPDGLYTAAAYSWEGKQILLGKIAFKSHTTTIPLPLDLPAGSYYLALQGNKFSLNGIKFTKINNE
ncbi:MAG: hypothetical protein EBX41_08365 [Chitinophagia bacterium]|nr:hypothetical protein [Chitinophagia bacterium]